MTKRKSASEKAEVKSTVPADPGNGIIQYKSVPKLWSYVRYFWKQDGRLWDEITRLQQEVEALKASFTPGGK